ncbi:hypothetical protein NBRC111894_625 [Sporolactobacillus inulinus]|uniref:Uncharacterized protein n=1 Tax=Sporolactobacillus inulinus TaxID=2078 RepID=A0A4Y1Z834_9BACL|nr:hypothetical protein NBRC111894_625 [Sporolactobacillus inulinus]
MKFIIFLLFFDIFLLFYNKNRYHSYKSGHHLNNCFILAKKKAFSLV